MSRLSRMVLILGGLTLFVAACRPPQNAYQPPPPPEVSVALPQSRTVPETLELTGLLRAEDVVEIRARVKGFLKTKHVTGGRRVAKDELLFTIDSRTFEADVRQAQAQVAAAKAQQRVAQVALERLRSAIAVNAASRDELDRAQAEVDAAGAMVDVADARLASAQLELSFTEVRSPIAGRLTMVPVDEGQLVGATEPTLLTTVYNDARVFAVYDIDERTVLELRRSNQNRRPNEDGRAGLEVRCGLANEVGYPHVGAFDKADARVDAATGTVRCEAVFDNKDGTLLPGNFVRIQSILGQREALLVPDVAVQADQLGRFLLVVNDNNVVERRNVSVGPVFERLRVIDSGLEPNAKVIVNGLQRARPGVPVKPSMVAPAVVAASQAVAASQSVVDSQPSR